mmetsp:Transcript_5637/g.11980  ORF Transcript_5637/g.11980 Transcript_5637/m.11980 type:complete len:87 (-) Transcript_5637:46-306(-)
MAAMNESTRENALKWCVCVCVWLVTETFFVSIATTWIGVSIDLSAWMSYGLCLFGKRDGCVFVLALALVFVFAIQLSMSSSIQQNK